MLSITIIKLVFVPSQHVWTEAPLAQQQMVHGGGEGMGMGGVKKAAQKPDLLDMRGRTRLNKKNVCVFVTFL